MRAENGSVRVEVANQGPPIPPDVIEHIFDPFRRGVRPSASEVPTGGLGLGLHIVHQIALAHRGTVSVRSSDGEGTRFSVRLPRHPEY